MFADIQNLYQVKTIASVPIGEYVHTTQRTTNKPKHARHKKTDAREGKRTSTFGKQPKQPEQ